MYTYSIVLTVSVRVVNDTSTGDGSQNYPFKITVREDAGTIFLFFEFEFTPTVPYIYVRCQTSDGTASKLCNVCYAHLLNL